MTVIDKTGASDAEFHARVAAFDAAPPPVESFDTVDRVMRAIWEAADGYMSGVPWERAKANPFKEAKAFRQAAAAIAAMPPSPAEEAVKRVEALAEVWAAGDFVSHGYARDLRAALAPQAGDGAR